jgi:hypothetical protein
MDYTCKFNCNKRPINGIMIRIGSSRIGWDDVDWVQSAQDVSGCGIM